MGIRIRRGSIVPWLVLAILLLLASDVSAQLKPEFMRNGECYLMIGEGPLSMRGIYRLNNPEKSKYYDPAIYLFTPNNSFTFAVDLGRKIYTFTEQVETGFTMLTQPLKRQVLDSVPANHADYGYHTWIHYDHRSWGKNTPVYRVGPVGRGIKRNGSGTWPHFTSAGPGTAITAPAGNPLPTFTGKLALDKIDGKNWYHIPNGAWYSSWKTATAIHNGYTWFYVVFGDKEEGKAHNWKLFTWSPNNLNLDAPAYSSSTGATVAVSYDKKITRQIFAGCLDGCGGASGSGSGVADVWLNDLAFMPPVKDKPSRTYFYSRPDGKPGAEITLNGAPYNPPTTGIGANPVIGLPDSTDTFWIGVSMRDVNSDYVYTLGNSVIKSWYTTVTGAPATGMSISAVAVSNQWNQEGGVVYAYDQSAKMIYKFIRKEKEGTPLASNRYQALSMSAILSAIGAHPTSVIDDIKADGFGSLYFALSHPSKNVADYNPKKHFKIDDAMFLHVPDWDSGEEISGFLIYKQPYGKTVFERNIYDGIVKKIGSKNYAERYFNVPIRVEKKGMEELVAAGAMPHSKTGAILASWSAEIGDNNGTFNEFDFSDGSLGLFWEYDFGDPGKCRLSVINVPTPPKVLSLGGKKSYLDLIGPYDAIPFYNSTDRHTNQGSGLANPAPNPLQTDHLYFYMVENYPLPDGAQDPNSQPNWDNDGRQGGFISSMVNPKSSRNGGRVFYRWRTWMVEDLYGRPVCKSLNDPEPLYGTDTGHNEYFYFYSPVSGKFIMTCHVAYDWYDYELLNATDTIQDLPNVLRTNTKAEPVSAGGLSPDWATNRLNSIMNMSDFSFMQASASLYISSILEGGNNHFALIPLVVGAATGTPDTSAEEEFKIQRCDEMAPADYNNNNNWFPKGTAMNPSLGYHGILAGKSYNWRLLNESQANIFFNINSSTNITVGAANFNYVAFKLMNDMGLNADGTEVNPFFVNRKPEFQFRNLPGDLKWIESDIRVTAYLEYKVPKAGGGFNVERKHLIQDPSNPGEPRKVPAISSNMPIIVTTLEDLPPTDPYDAELVIEMRRMFEYNMWIRIWNGTSWVWASYLTLPKEMRIKGKTKVIIVDMKPPTIAYDETSPHNLFGETGKPLTAGVGPSGKGNPSDVFFTIVDNNPWEAVDGVWGITDLATFNNNKTENHNLINITDPLNPTFKKAKPTAQYNLLPVFAKLINRRVEFQMDTASRKPSGAYEKVVQPPSDDYSHYYYRTSPSAPIQEHTPRYTIAEQTFSELVGGTTKYRGKIKYKLPLNWVRIGAGDSLQIPIGYANNTPGYGNKLVNNKLIKPYRFYLGATDSSGNVLSPRELNMALHVKDIIAPFPYGVSTEEKDNRTAMFPAGPAAGLPSQELDPDNFENYYNNLRDRYAYNENIILNSWVNSNNWAADKDGLIANTPFRALKSMGNTVVLAWNDAEYLAQIENNLPPGFAEDNVPVRFSTGVMENAGMATSTLIIRYNDSLGVEQSRTVSSGWESTSDPAGSIVTASSTVAVVFRGRPEQFPMAAPIQITAVDNARDWDYYVSGSLLVADNPYSGWKWDNVFWGSDTSNSRTFNTSFPAFGSRLIIRTIDKGIRNR